MRAHAIVLLWFFVLAVASCKSKGDSGKSGTPQVEPESTENKEAEPPPWTANGLALQEAFDEASATKHNSRVPYAEMTLAEYAAAVPEQTLGFHIGDSKAGFYIVEYRVGTWNGQPAAFQRDAMELQASMGGSDVTTKGVELFAYATTQDGKLLAAYSRDEDGEEVVQADLLARGEDHELTREINGKPQSPQTVDVKELALEKRRDYSAFLQTGSTGDSRSQPTVNWFDQPFIEQELTTLGECGKRQFLGVATEVCDSEQHIPSMKTTAEQEVARDGRLLRGSLGPLTMQWEDRVSVREGMGNASLDAIAVIELDTHIPDPQQTTELVLELEEPDEKIPSTDRQSFSATDDGRAQITIRTTPIATREELTSEAQWTQLSPVDQGDADELLTLANRIAGDANDDRSKAKNLVAWIYKELDKRSDRNANAATQILRNGAGDCTEHSELFVALARSLEIPARRAVGYVYVEDESGFAAHQWSEYYADGAWYAVDPSWNEMVVNATHLKMATGTALGGMFSLPKLKVVSFKTRR